jgi:hypothetical protein
MTDKGDQEVPTDPAELLDWMRAQGGVLTGLDANGCRRLTTKAARKVLTTCARPGCNEKTERLFTNGWCRFENDQLPDLPTAGFLCASHALAFEQPSAH